VLALKSIINQARSYKDPGLSNFGLVLLSAHCWQLVKAERLLKMFCYIHTNMNGLPFKAMIDCNTYMLTLYSPPFVTSSMTSFMTPFMTPFMTLYQTLYQAFYIVNNSFTYLVN